MADTAVIINEFGEIGLDHLLVDEIEDGIIELSSGCLCCTIRGDLVSTLENLLRRLDNNRLDKLQRVVIETTGLADPAPVLHSVMLHPYLVLRYRLDGVITLVDAVNGLDTIRHYEEAVKQVAVADRILLTKTDLVDGDEHAEGQAALLQELKRLNPGAEVFDNWRVKPLSEALVHCGLYNPKTKIPDVARWLKEEEFHGDHSHHHHDHSHGHSHNHHGAESEKAHTHHASSHGAHTHGHHHHDHAHDVNRHSADIRAFTLTHDKPIGAGVLEMFIDLLRSGHGPKLLRVKGIINVAEHPDEPLVIHGVQHVFHPPAKLAEWPDDDRRSKLVFIVKDLPEGFVRRMFGAFTGGIAPDTPDKDALAVNPLSVPGFGGGFKPR